MSVIVTILSAILITAGIYLIVNGVGILYDNLKCLGIGVFAIGVLYTALGALLLGVSIYNIVMLL